MALLLTDEEIGQVFTMEDAVQAVEECFRQWALGGASLPPRIAVPPPNSPGHFYLRWLMPGTVHSAGGMGAKLLVSPSPGTPPPARSRFVLLLFDSTDGSILALMQGTALSHIRTGAVTGVGTKYLAREDSRSLAIFGSSKYAAMQAVGVCAVRPIDNIKVYSPNPDHRRSFAKEVERLTKANVLAVDTGAEALTNSDVVVTVTNSREPVFDGNLLEAGIHLSVVGSSIPDQREVDVTTLRRSKVVVEYLDQALKEAGDLVIPIKEGVYSADDVYAEISQVVSGEVPARVSEDEITLFKFNGIAIEDIACALKAYQRAVDHGVGVEFNL